MSAKDKRPAGSAPSADSTSSPPARASHLRQGSGQAGPALRQQAEATLREKTAQSPENLEALSPEATRIILHELRVHQIELEMQNDELRRAQVELDAERARYFDLYDLAPVGYCTVSEPGLILQANLAAATLLGAARGALLQQPISRFIFKEDADIYYLLRKQIIKTGEPQSCELRMVKNDGTPSWVHLATTAAQDEDGAPVLLVVVSDISERRQAEQQLIAGQESLRESALRTQTILDNMADGVVTINVLGLMESFNKAASGFFGYAPEEVLGRNVAILMPEPYRSQLDGYWEHDHETDEARVIGLPREVEGQRKDGSLFPMSLSVSRISLQGQTTFIALVRDITEHRQDEEKIRRLAFHDSLTGLPNRRLLTDRLRQVMLADARTGQHGALMFLDLDHFKKLNDTLGHAGGDQLLLQVARRLQSCVRKVDTVARLGGDEFVVLLQALSIHDHEAATQAEVIANKIRAAVGQAYRLGGQTYTTTPSIGIVVFMQDQESVDDLLNKADAAMYQAKAAGRNTSRFFDPAMQAAAAAHTRLEKDLRRGLAQHEFVLHYQIQVDGNGAPTSAEALVRWDSPNRGMVLPAHFIPLAEETGIILPLGQWVLETACAQLVEWARKTETAQWTMAVNVSAYQFSKADFVANVAAALQKTGANPRLLRLELTESMLVDDVEGVIAKMNEIKAQGVCFSLDDFGTGYSSLSYLKRLPLDQLKIDQSFVRDLLTDANDAAIARTIVGLSHSLGLKAIAEGVETVGQRDFLAGIGCDAYQGYYFGRPVPAINSYQPSPSHRASSR